MATPVNDPAQQFIAAWIERDPHHPGLFDVRLRQHGVPVWAIIGDLHLPGQTFDRTAAAYAVPTYAVIAAWMFYERNRAIIDARIEANEA